MHISKFRISQESTKRLRVLRNRAGLTPNLICRMALTLSFEMGRIGSVPDVEEGQEFNAYTLFGIDQPIYITLLRMVEISHQKNQTNIEISDLELRSRLRAHIDRGIVTLSARIKSPSDVARLLAGDYVS